ncbi:CDP-diacylglycerol--glycerol-3-phosphate 3-phosphatidyltransferase [Microbispora triticiradicis]|uniref:CDP-diacylglycerol--glycerol-3-phosphate 3-phosphatidyltransferase n=3 Tax=Microbispora TaxID=2005 RepID=A0ABY3LTP1_9ACTN|nr:CDP-diacylglycerol--glycerol-3-phosphate 3-phosphatidyltransferase [Microbispora triticiradicis]TLP58833.1 CDP-diacylglycerol--glycerol-3-phosphate 3-phosphatidyltransferase [Microbispora fusca]TYB52153.1 CDP-diacylglycerol--glycerol-3-phosphate 3-phosphatidyltransferase [Microbispora tritici]GLW21542.1 CDP-diacylglycerol--glycerol-3-phosphate 3-phosphatidyltransferase [Microbispora amethystogenes]
MTERGEPPVEVAGPVEAAVEATVEAPVEATAEIGPSPAAAVPVAPPAPVTPEPLTPVPAAGEEGTARRVSTWNIANALTIARLAIVPVFVVFLFAEGEAWRLAALGVFLLASVTDQLDGWLARKYALITDFGKIADPIADKALIGAALLCLSYLGELAWWVTLVIIAREAGVTLLRFLVIRHGVIPASYGGKVKTVLQIVAIALYIVPVVPDLARWAAMGLALVVTVGTGADYVVRAVRLRQVAKRARTV